MDAADQQAIADLFARLAQAERSAPPRDPEAERFIAERIAAQPSAPYLMAQTIVVLEASLAEARAQAEAAAQPRGFFDSLFGEDHRPEARRAPPRPAAGGGFLAGAAQTAAGVAGGILLGTAIGGLIAPEAGAPDTPEGEAAGGTDPGLDGDFDL